MELITAGNPNLGTLASVLSVVPRHYSRHIAKVFFLDTDNSDRDASGNSLEVERNELVRKYAGPNVQLAQQNIEKRLLSVVLPELLSGELKLRDREEIVIDLTNGTKAMSALLYAAGSLLQVKQLFFLTVKPLARQKKPEQYESTDYWVELIDPLQNIRELGKHGFFDLIYYRETINSILKNLPKGFHSFSSIELEQTLLRAIEEFFKNDFKGSTTNAGRIGESISMYICEKIKNEHKGKIKRKKPYDFNDSIIFLNQEICENIRVKLRDDEELTSIEKRWLPLRNADKILDYIRVLRNEASHPRRYEFARGEAKAVIDGVLGLLENLGSLDVRA